MTREQTIDAAVRDYMQYRDEVAPGIPGKVWARYALTRPEYLYSTGSDAAIRVLYWLIKCGEETFGP